MSLAALDLAVVGLLTAGLATSGGDPPLPVEDREEQHVVVHHDLGAATEGLTAFHRRSIGNVLGKHGGRTFAPSGRCHLGCGLRCQQGTRRGPVRGGQRLVKRGRGTGRGRRVRTERGTRGESCPLLAPRIYARYAKRIHGTPRP